MLNCMSSATASGIGRIAAISSTLMYLFAQATSVVCFWPVSPLTQYTTGSADRTGNRVCAAGMGMRRKNRIAADSSSAAFTISAPTFSGMVAATSARVVSES